MRSGLFHLLLVPLDGAAESFFKADERLVAEGIAQISFDELNSVEDFCKILLASGFKIIKAADSLSALNKRLADPGAQESGAADYKIASHVSSIVAVQPETV